MTLEAAGFKWTYRPEKQTSSHTGKMELITSSIMTNEQIEQKKQQLKQLAEEAQQLKNELIEAGAWPLSDDELDKAAGGISGRGWRPPTFRKDPIPDEPSIFSTDL